MTSEAGWEQRFWTGELEEERHRTQKKFIVVQRHLTYLLFYWTALPLLITWNITTMFPAAAKKLHIGTTDWRVVTGVLFLSGLSVRLPLSDLFGSKEIDDSPDAADTHHPPPS